MLGDLDAVITVENQAHFIGLFLCRWANAQGKRCILHDDQGSHDQIAGVEPVGLEECQRLIMAFLGDGGSVFDLFDVPDAETVRPQHGYAEQPTLGILDGQHRVHSTWVAKEVEGYVKAHIGHEGGSLRGEEGE